MDAFIGTIIPVAFPFAPPGWALCNGQTMQVNQYEALFALLGTTYGGDGRTTFGLPDLCGRTAIGAQGAAILPAPTISLGQATGPNAANSTVAVTSTGTANATIQSNHLPQVTVTGTINGASLTAQSSLNATTTGPGATAPAIGSMLSATATSGNSSAAAYYVNPTPAIPLTTVKMSSASVGTVLNGSPTVTASMGAGTPLAASLATVATPAGISPMQPSLALNYIICLLGLYPTQN